MGLVLNIVGVLAMSKGMVEYTSILTGDKKLEGAKRRYVNIKNVYKQAHELNKEQK